jgi:hypothetical protein
MVMAVWLIAKGFNSLAIAAESARETSVRQTALPFAVSEAQAGWNSGPT